MPFMRDRLRNTRKNKDMTLEEVAGLVGVAKQTIQRYETGEIKSVDTSTVEKLASALRVTPGFLMGWTDDPNGLPADAETIPEDGSNIVIFDKGKAYDASKLPDKAQNDIDDILKRAGVVEYIPTHKIPVLGRVAAGLPMYAEQNIEGYTYAQLPAGGNYFALKIKGDSMTAARIFDNDIIIVREQEIVENGEIAVVAVNGDDATVKKFYREGDIITLSPCSFNPEHQVQIYNTKNIEIHVIGKVVLSQTVFE